MGGRVYGLDSGRVPPPPVVSDPIIQEPGIVFCYKSPLLAWSSHFDDEGKVYYYNRHTKKSTYKKPQNFDGYDPAANNPLLSAPDIFKATPFCNIAVIT